jgi:hypothetical protein
MSPIAIRKPRKRRKDDETYIGAMFAVCIAIRRMYSKNLMALGRSFQDEKGTPREAVLIFHQKCQLHRDDGSINPEQYVYYPYGLDERATGARNLTDCFNSTTTAQFWNRVDEIHLVGPLIGRPESNQTALVDLISIFPNLKTIKYYSKSCP